RWHPDRAIRERGVQGARLAIPRRQARSGTKELGGFRCGQGRLGMLRVRTRTPFQPDRSTEEMSERKQQLLEIGVKLAAKYGVENVTRVAIAKAAKITPPAVGKYLGNRDEMLKAIKKALRAAGKSEPDKKVI